MRTISEIRPSPIAGHWYSGIPHVLREEISQYLQNVKPLQIEGNVVGLVAPHAGYRYSGQTAAFAYKTVEGNSFDLVVLLSPYHQYHPASVLSTKHNYYQTPLGDIPVDHELLDVFFNKNVEKQGLEGVKIAHDQEHSLEIELPFLQVSLHSDFQLLPLMIRNVDSKIAEEIGVILADCVKDKNVLIVCSTDLSHFYSQQQAEKFDLHMLQQIQTLSTKNIYEAEARKLGFACGLGAVMVGVQACKLLGANQAEILHHSTSGEITADFSSVVGYGSVVFLHNQPLVN